FLQDDSRYPPFAVPNAGKILVDFQDRRATRSTCSPPFPRRRCLRAGRIAVLAVLLAVVPRLLSAQTVVAPTFTAGSRIAPDSMLDADVSVGADDTMAILWTEVDGHRYATGKAFLRRFSADGVELGPAVGVDTTDWANSDIPTTIDSDTRGGFV